MEKKRTIGDPTVTGPISGGGGGGRGGSSSFSLPRAKPQFEIWSKRQNKMVGTAANVRSAGRMIDRRDNEYGAYDHYKKKIGD